MLLYKKRLFIVEDNLENRIVYNMILTKQGAEFEFARWGHDAVSRLKRFAPVDLIILDLMLPRGQNGFQVFEEIYQHSEFRTIPIIAVSAADPAVTVPMVRNQGFTGFFSKPIDGDIFPAQLAAVLEGKLKWIEG